MKGFGQDSKPKKKLKRNIHKRPSKEQIINQAINFHIQGNIPEAIKYYQYCINQGFNDHIVFSNYAGILQGLGKIKEAELLQIAIDAALLGGEEIMKIYAEEFEVLTSNYSSDEYESKKMEMSEYSEFTKKFIFSLHSVNKLKATNVLLGFSRGGAEGKFNPARNERKFLPAFGMPDKTLKRSNQT